MEELSVFLDNFFSTLLVLIQITWWFLIPLICLFLIHEKWPDWLLSRNQSKHKHSVLEVIPPPDVLKTPKAMENVLVGLSGGWKPMNKRDKWWRGEHQDTFSLEMMGNNGSLRFFVRCRHDHVSWVESKFYSEYPDAELHEVEDYVESLPNYAPNKVWDIWGASYALTDPHHIDPPWAIPLRTYLEFEDINEDRRTSPLSQLGELVAKLGPSEYCLIQLIISPRLGEVSPKFDKVINKLTGKDTSEGGKSIIGETLGFVIDISHNVVRGILGHEVIHSSEEKKESNFSFFNLTKAEQDRINSIAIKKSKVNFETNIHAMYLFKRSQAHQERIGDMNGFFRQFSDENRNGLKPASGTYSTSNIYFRRKKKNLVTMRRLYFAYKSRWMGYLSHPYILSTEEIASIFHLPGQIVQTPSLGRIRSRSTQPPQGLL